MFYLFDMIMCNHAGWRKSCLVAVRIPSTHQLFMHGPDPGSCYCQCFLPGMSEDGQMERGRKIWIETEGDWDLPIRHIQKSFSSVSSCSLFIRIPKTLVGCIFRWWETIKIAVIILRCLGISVRSQSSSKPLLWFRMLVKISSKNV